MLILALFFLLFSQASSDPLRAGLQALQQGRLDQAEADLKRASDATPQNSAVWISLAEVELRLGKREAAQSYAAKAEELANGNPVVLHLLALYYSEANHPGRAGDFEEKSADVRNDSAAYDRAAKYFMSAGDTDKALQAASKASAGNPELAFNWGRTFLEDRSFTEAAHVLEPAVRNDPRNAQLVLALGVARYGQRRFEDAITNFLDVIDIDPSVPQPYEFLGRMLDQSGARLTQITALFRRYSADRPDDPRAMLFLAKALLTSHPDDNQAEALLRHSISINGSDWESHYELGVYLERKRSFTEAEAELSRAVQLKESEPEPHYHLARVYARLGETEKAAAERAVHARLTGSSQ